MKKLLSILLALAMVMALLVGCGPSNSTTPNSGDDSSSDANSGAPTVVSQEAVDEALAAAESAGLPDASGDAAQTLIFSGASFTTMTEAEELFKFMIEDLSGGSIKIDWHPYNELGDDLNVISNVQFGEIDIGLTSPAPVTTMLPNMSIFDTLYMINDQETAYEVMDGEIGQQIDKDVEALGMKVLMWCENGFRNLTCNVEVTGLDSLKGLKIRTMENSLQMDAWKALGANPTPMNFGEVYTALQQGTVEGQENPLGLIETNGFMEVQDYLVLSEHNYTPMPVMINLEKYNSLTDNQRAIMDYVSDYVEQWERERNIEVNQQILDQFKADNVNIIELDDATKDSFRQAIDDAGVYDEIREALANPELMDVLEGLNA